jgi:hypothetical protein
MGFLLCLFLLFTLLKSVFGNGALFGFTFLGQTDRKQLQDGLSEKCESEKSTITKNALEESEK